MTDSTSPPSPLSRLKPVAGRALEIALNRALALDPDTRDSLRALDGRRVALRLASPPLALQVTVNGERLEVGPVDGEVEPDLSVRSTIGGLISQLPFLRTPGAAAEVGSFMKTIGRSGSLPPCSSAWAR